MDAVIQGIIAGTVFGIASTIPLFQEKLERKSTVMVGSFVNRFAIGLLTFTTDFNVPTLLTGVIIGTLLSVPEAIITKDYKRTFMLGIIGGLICGEIAWIR